MMSIYFGKSSLTCEGIILDGKEIESVDNMKVLGVIINKKLSWQEHINHITAKASSRLYFLRLLQRAGISPSDIFHVYTCIIRPILEYACEVWHGGLTKGQSECLEHVQKRAVRIALPGTGYIEALDQLSAQSLYHQREDRCKRLFKDMCKPDHKLNHLLPPLRSNIKGLRKSRMYALPKTRTERFKNSPVNYCIFKYQ